MTWEILGKIATSIVWLMRAIGARGLLFRVRSRSARAIVRPLHLNILHRMRRLAILLEDWGSERDDCVLLAQQIATECRRVMGTILELKSNEIHCCIKAMVDDNRVATWVRSEPFNDRRIEQGEANAHSVETNSVWSALCGKNDGKTNWLPFTCFACNDLTSQGALFKCDRKDWQRYYRSTLVFPLRYPKDLHCDDYILFGFLAFDSPKKNAFRGLPDIYSYRDDPAAYRDHLEGSMVFNVGAIMADTLGAILGASQHQSQEGNDR